MNIVVLKWSLLLYLHFALGLLHESDLEVLVEDLQSVQKKWEAIGRGLYIGEETLEDIHIQYSHTSPGDALREVFREWLPNNWHNVVTVLKSVGEEHLASELKVKYGELSTTDLSLIWTDAEFSLNTVDISGPKLLLSCDSIDSCCSW